MQCYDVLIHVCENKGKNMWNYKMATRRSFILYRFIVFSYL